GQKSRATDESCGTDCERAVAADEAFGRCYSRRRQQPARIPLDRRAAVPTSEPVAQVVAGHRAADANEQDRYQLKPSGPDQVAGQREYGLLRHRQTEV